ncbi:MAG: DUF1697 domain-containing protein [Acidimicrobiales bacterium]
MPTYVCLLRGVNVGGKNKLPMKALSELFESLGYAGVRTFIQSGNVVFSSQAKPAPAKLKAAIADLLSLEVPVVVRSAAELKRVVAANPFDDVERVHVAFMGAKPAAAAVRSLEPGPFEPERFAVKGTEIYLYLPNGMGRTKLPSYLDRRLKGDATIRNWKTTCRLAEMAGQA